MKFRIRAIPRSPGREAAARKQLYEEEKGDRLPPSPRERPLRRMRGTCTRLEAEIAGSRIPVSQLYEDEKGDRMPPPRERGPLRSMRGSCRGLEAEIAGSRISMSQV